MPDLLPRIGAMRVCAVLGVGALALWFWDSLTPWKRSFHCRPTGRWVGEPVCFHSKDECRGLYDAKAYECHAQRVASCFRVHYSSPVPPPQHGEWDDCYPHAAHCRAASIDRERARRESTWPDGFDEDCRTIEVSDFKPYPWPYAVSIGLNGEILAEPREVAP